MTIDQAAARLGIAPSTVRHQLRAGRLEGEKRGRDWWLTDGAVERYRVAHLGRVGRPRKVTSNA